MTVVDKPWGYELIWAQTERYVGKLLHIRAGEALSLQYHRVKDETIMVLTGRLSFEHFAEGQPSSTIELGPREPFHVTPGLRHRMDRCLSDTLYIMLEKGDDLRRTLLHVEPPFACEELRQRLVTPLHIGSNLGDTFNEVSSKL